jgi:hypothetical protein
MIDPRLTKFRPVLTLEQISYITSLCQASLNGADIKTVHNEELSKSIKKVLVPMISKIEVGAINPAYKLSEIAIQKQAERSEQIRYESGEMSQEESDAYESKILGV